MIDTDPIYRVRLEGRNFQLFEAGEVRRMGFFVTVFVRARDPEAAREAAVRAIASDGDLLEVLRNAADDPPDLFSLEATPLPPAVAPPEKRTAFELWPDDGTRPEPGERGPE